MGDKEGKRAGRKAALKAFNRKAQKQKQMQCTLQYGRQNKRSDLLVHTRVTSPSFPFSLSFFLSFCLFLSLHPTPSHRKTLLTVGKHEIKQLIPPALKLCRRLIMITREPSMPPPRSSGHRSLPIYRSIDNRLRHYGNATVPAAAPTSARAIVILGEEEEEEEGEKQ